MIAFQPAETFVHSAKWSQVRLWHLTDFAGQWLAAIDALHGRPEQAKNESAATAFSKDECQPRFSSPLSSLDTHALPVSILRGDAEFPPGQHAGAIPPGSLPVPAQEHFGFYALRVVPVSECVFAGC
jgi:hypothetical protein